MIQNIDKWRAWEDAYVRSTPVDFAENVRIAEALLEHARRLGVFPPTNPLDGIEHKIGFAKALNVSLRPRPAR